MFRKYLNSFLLILALNIGACKSFAPVAIETPAVTTPTEKLVHVETEAASISAFPMTITDDVGRKVTIGSIPTRIISLSPAITEILFAVGAGPAVIGNTKYCDYPADAVKVTKIGGYSADSISVETIISLEPELVLAEGDRHEAVISALEQANIPVLAIETNSLNDIYANIELAGKITDHEYEAAAVVKEMMVRVDRIEEKIAAIPEEDRLTVFWEVWDEPLLTAGPNTFIGKIIQAAGGVNIFSELTEDWPAVSAEEVVQRNPAVILGPDTHGDTLIAEQLVARSGWEQVDAVKTNRIFLIDGDASSRPGPRIVDALESIARSLYPDLFEE